MLDFARLRFDLSVTGTLLTEEREHPELLEAARRQMIVPAIDRFRQVLRAGIERGEVRPDLDVDAAAHALLGSFFIRYLELGRPGPGWAEGSSTRSGRRSRRLAHDRVREAGAARPRLVLPGA